MRKSTLVYTGAAIAATAVLVLAGGGAAYAQSVQPPTGPDTAACAEAGTEVAAARAVLAAKAALDSATTAKAAADQAVIDAKKAPASGDLVNDPGTVTADDVQAQITRLEALGAGGRTGTQEQELTADRKLLAAINAAPVATAALATAKGKYAAAGGDSALQDLAVAGGLPALVTAQNAACTAPSATTTPSATPAPTTTPTPTTTPDVDYSPLYATCAEATAAGAAPLNRGQLGYRPALDSDDDGVACESPAADALPTGGAATGG